MKNPKTKSAQREARSAPPHGSVICGDCGTLHEIGNGITCAADKPGHMHLHSRCPKCGHKTWSEPFVMRSMTKAKIAKRDACSDQRVVEMRPNQSPARSMVCLHEYVKHPNGDMVCWRCGLTVKGGTQR